MKNYQLNFCLFYFIYYITFGAFSPYLNVYFDNLGLSGDQIGTINSLCMLAGMLAAPLFGMIADKTRKTKFVMGTLLVLSALSLYVFSIQTKYYPILITFILFGIFKNDIGNLQDSICSKYCNSDNVDFSKIRIFGSFGYLFGSFVLATVLSKLGIEGPYIKTLIFCYLFSVLILFILPSDIEESNKTKINIIPAAKQLFKDKNFITITIIYLFAMCLVDIVNNYIGMHFVNAFKLDSSKVAFYTFVMILPELIILSNGGKIIDKLGWKRFYTIAALGQILRYVVYSLTSNVIIFYIATFTHGLSVLMSAVCNIRFMSEKINRDLLSTAISTYGSVALITQALYNKIFGMLIDKFGTYSIFYFSLILSLILLIIVRSTKIFNDMKKE